MWTASTTVLLPQDVRARVLDAFRDVAYVHPADNSTETVLEQLRPAYFVKGRDWEGRLPRGGATNLRRAPDRSGLRRYGDQLIE